MGLTCSSKKPARVRRNATRTGFRLSLLPERSLVKCASRSPHGRKCVGMTHLVTGVEK